MYRMIHVASSILETRKKDISKPLFLLLTMHLEIWRKVNLEAAPTPGKLKLNL